MKVLFCASLLVGYSLTCISQNLIANPGFEDENLCTELHAFCAPAAWVGVSPGFPRNQIHYTLDPTIAIAGKHCVGILHEGGEQNATLKTESGNARTYLQSKLLNKLICGQAYHISFLIATARNNFTDVGFLFPAEPLFKETEDPLLVVPDILFTRTQVTKTTKKNKVKWLLVNGTYVAKGNERFIVIGNFSPDIEKQRPSWYYIDELSMIPVNAQIDMVERNQNLQALYNDHKRHSIEKWAIDKKEDPVLLPAPPVLSVPVKREVAMTAIEDTITLPDVLFAFNSYTINPAFYTVLDSVANKLGNSKCNALEITGYTDNKGTDVYNQELSLKRATAIASYIWKQYPALQSLTLVAGNGATRPVADNSDEKGRSRNRRVEIILH